MKYPKPSKRRRISKPRAIRNERKIPPIIRTKWNELGAIDWNQLQRGVLVDTCVIIDAVAEKNSARELIALCNNPRIASVSRIEALSLKNERFLTPTVRLISSMTPEDLTEEIQDKASALRRKRKPEKLADAIIAATAIIRRMPILTFDLKDFDLPELDVLDPKRLLARSERFDRELDRKREGERGKK